MEQHTAQVLKAASEHPWSMRQVADGLQ